MPAPPPTPSHPLISAVVCTHNRGSLLDLALLSLAEQSLAPALYEVLIVDNASTDDTRSIAEAWAARYPHFRYIRESQIGLSYARNRGVQEARSPLIAYLDDDARACRDWLARLIGAFNAPAAPAVVGGPVALLWEGGRPPPWMNKQLIYALSFVDYGPTPRPVGHVNGCNMAFQKSAIEALGGFKTHLGRQGKALLGGEESDLIGRLRNDGAVVYYEPGAQVEHFITRPRQTVRYLVRVYYGLGRSQALRQRQHKLYRIRQSLGQVAWELQAALRYTRPMTGPGVLVILVCQLAFLVGAVYGYVTGPRQASVYR